MTPLIPKLLRRITVLASVCIALEFAIGAAGCPPAGSPPLPPWSDAGCPVLEASAPAVEAASTAPPEASAPDPLEAGGADAAGDAAASAVDAKPPAPDVFDQACAVKAKYGCKDLSGGHCAEVLRSTAASGHVLFTKASATCITKATGAAMISKCAGVACAK